MAQVAQSPRRGSSDWRYVGVGRTDYGSGSAAETFGGGDFVDPRTGSEFGGVPGYHPGSCCGIRGRLRGGSGQGQFAQRGEGSASDEKTW